MTRWWGSVALGLGIGVAVGPVCARGETPDQPESLRASVPAEDILPYNPNGRRDPFRPPRAGSGETAEPLSPLERYELGQLRLVAIINSADARAVVEDDAGLGFILKVGTRIGPNGGQVQTIERGRVVVREEYVDFYGENHPTEVVLELKPGATPRDGERGKR